MFNSIKVILVALILSLAVSGTASAGHQDFTLINQTGRYIINLLVTSSHSYYWNDDIPGVDILQNGESTHIIFDRIDPDRYWDIMVIFNNGNDVVQNAESQDSVFLGDVILEQISGAQFTDSGVSLNFSDGGSLNISGQPSTFIIGNDGTFATYSADYQNKT